MYNIKKVLNSSVVLVCDKNNNEFILLGKGLGYGRKNGEEISVTEKNQIFVPAGNLKTNQFLELLNEIPLEILQVTREIILEAERLLGVEFNNNLYFSLADHLNFAIERMKKGIKITNRVFWEIKNYYPDEFKAGLLGISRVEELGIYLPEEEAANLAFYFANAKSANDDNYDSMRYAKVIGEITNIAVLSINRTINKSNVHYMRFITHIKFFVERYFTDNLLQSKDTILYYQITNNYPKETLIAEKIRNFLKNKYEKDLTDEEMTYLIVHIARISTIGE